MNLPAGQRHIMILAGEPSGDFHGGNLIKELRRMAPDLYISGIGGPCMKALQAHIFFPMEKLSAMGLVEVIFQFRSIQQAFKRFKFQLNSQTPDLLILIDYPGFNLWAARYAKEKFKIPVFYYIPPKVWAWKKSRLKTIKQYVDHAALIFPFEEMLYKKADIPCTYVGNPLMDDFPDHETKPFLSILEKPCLDAPVIGLLPGSRRAEIDNLLGTMLKTARIILKSKPKARFLVSAAGDTLEEKIHQLLVPYHQECSFSVVQGRPLEIFKSSDLLIAASGTVTLEAALCCLPTIIVYKMSPISYGLARLLVRVKYAGLANLIAGRELMPELLQERARPETIAKKALSMLENLKIHQDQLLLVRRRLGRPGASKKAAQIALGLVK